jgi:uncharacterized membrane protein YidH (DUF202 family)
MLIVGGLFSVYSFGAGLGAFLFLTLVFVVLPGLILLYVGRKRWEKREREERKREG